MIVETDASDIGYGGNLKQRKNPNSSEQLIRYTLGIWNSTQKNYSTIKKEILAIVLSVKPLLLKGALDLGIQSLDKSF